MKSRPDTCAACKQQFKPGDDIVTCPECGAPYHRDCYQKAGHCVFEAKHGLGFEYVDPASQQHGPAAGPAQKAGSAAKNYTGPVRCPKCGTLNKPANIFCEKCGHPLHAEEPPKAQAGWQRAGMGGMPGAAAGATAASVEEVDGIPAKDWATYVGQQAPSYLYRLSVQKQRNTKTGFIFSAFFLGPFYYAYRKMWGWAALTFVLWVLFSVPPVLEMLALAKNPLVAGFTLSSLEMFSQVMWLVNIAVRIVFSVFALYLFRKSAAKRMHALREKYPDEAQYQTQLAKLSGPSVLGAVAVLALLTLLVGLLPYLLGIDLAALMMPYM